jgi:sugar lactone lactonase YvrE
MNPLLSWRLDPGTISTTGHGLSRPECVLQDDNGDLIVADLGGGVMRIDPEGRQEVIKPKSGGGPFAPAEPNIDGNQGFSMPNGLCFDAAGDFVIANFGTNRLEHLSRNGEWRLILDEMDGKPLGKTNFPAIDGKGRLWFTVTASIEGWKSGRSLGEADGYIAVIDENGPRIVADGISGANEIRFTENETRLYVAETGGDHISRFRVNADATLSDREIYGPEHLGGGPDGFCFDAYGNIWTTLIAVDRLVAITPEGDVLTIWEDGDRAVKDAIAARNKWEGRRLELGPAPGDGLAPRMASVTFGGPDMCTVYVGSLVGTSLPTFRAPLPGARIPRP